RDEHRKRGRFGPRPRGIRNALTARPGIRLLGLMAVRCVSLRRSPFGSRDGLRGTYAVALTEPMDLQLLGDATEEREPATRLGHASGDGFLRLTGSAASALA